MVLYSKFAYGSQFSGEKSDMKIRYLVAEIFSKNRVSFSLGHPVHTDVVKGTVPNRVRGKGTKTWENYSKVWWTIIRRLCRVQYQGDRNPEYNQHSCKIFRKNIY